VEKLTLFAVIMFQLQYVQIKVCLFYAINRRLVDISMHKKFSKVRLLHRLVMSTPQTSSNTPIMMYCASCPSHCTRIASITLDDTNTSMPYKNIEVLAYSKLITIKYYNKAEVLPLP
jgi:hypothetical protein